MKPLLEVFVFAIRKRRFLTVYLLASLSVSLCTPANAGIRGPGKYSGVVVFDRWDGCILFSGVYLMYVSERVKDQLRSYDGQAIELNALEVIQPTNPGDGLIRKLQVLGPAPPSKSPFTFEGISLDARAVAVKDVRAAIELKITNESDTPAKIDTSQIGFVVLSEKIVGVQTPSDGPSTAVITRSNVFLGKGTFGFGDGETIHSYSYVIPDSLRLPQSFELAPRTSRTTRIRFELPAGHYQLFAGYGGGVHESNLNVSNAVSIDLWDDGQEPEVRQALTAGVSSSVHPEAVRVSSAVMQSRLLRRVEPVFPAEMLNTEGALVLSVSIDKGGNVYNAHRVSGPEILVAPAIEAVK